MYQIDLKGSARTDHGVCIGYDVGDPDSFMAPAVWVDLDIDHTGKTSSHMAWRVKVLPNCWCTECGVFKEDTSRAAAHENIVSIPSRIFCPLHD